MLFLIFRLSNIVWQIVASRAPRPLGASLLVAALRLNCYCLVALIELGHPPAGYRHKKSAKPMSFNSHELTLNMPLFFCKRNGLGSEVFFVFPISLSTVNITHSKTPENRQQADILQTIMQTFSKKDRFIQC